MDPRAPAGRDRHALRARAGAIYPEVASDRTRVARIAHPVDVETLAEPGQHDAVDLAVSRVAERLLLRVDRANRAGANRGTEKLGGCERGAAGDERIAELPAHVIVEGEQAFDVRHGDIRWQAPKIDGRRRALKTERERLVEADRRILRRDVGAVGDCGGLRDEHRRSGDFAARLDVIAGVV